MSPTEVQNIRDSVAIVISAASGTGKSSLARALVDETDHVELSVSHTTRDIRPGEQNGRDYHFISKDEFEEMIAANEFIEYAKVFGNFYGTSQRAISNQLTEGCDVVLDIDWQGSRLVRASIESVIGVFLLPPSLDTLEQRLKDRGRDDSDTVKNRMDSAISEMNHCFEYDHIVVNDNFEDALLDLRHVVNRTPNLIRPIPPTLFEELQISQP